MSDVKKNLLKEIEDKIKRKMELREQIAKRNQLDTFVLNFISNVEEISESINDQDMWMDMVELAIKSLDESIKSLDARSTTAISWAEGNRPQVNGVLVRWSAQYQEKNNCEPELFVDMTSLLFK